MTPPSASATAPADTSGAGRIHLRRRAAHEPSAEHLEQIAELVRQAQAGDREAFAQLYDRYVDGIYRYLYFRTLSHSLAEDLTSETFLRALRRLPTFRWQGTDINAWLLTIARNLTLDHVKSSTARLESLSGDISSVSDAEHRAAEDTESVVLRGLSAEALMAAVGRLKDDQRECVTLRFLQGLSVAETAAVLSRSEGAVKQLQLRAMRQLAALLGPLREGAAER